MSQVCHRIVGSRVVELVTYRFMWLNYTVTGSHSIGNVIGLRFIYALWLEGGSRSAVGRCDGEHVALLCNKLS